MDLREFQSKYIFMIESILATEIPDFNLNAASTQKLLTYEDEWIEQEYYAYKYDFKKNPDYNHLQNCITRFGVERLSLFDNNSREITKQKFIEFYINQIKLHRNFNRYKFSTEDYIFILSRETSIADKEFDAKTNNVPKYQELNIERSIKTQDLLLQKLLYRFEQDLKSFYFGMKIIQ